MRFLRLEPLNSIKMGLVIRKTNRIEDWKGEGLEIKLYKNS